MIRSVISFLKKGGFLFVLLAIALVLNHRTGYISIIGLFSLLVFVTVTLKNGFDKRSIVIAMYVIFYVLLSSLNGFVYSPSILVLYAVAPLFFYQFGRNLVTRFEDNNHIIVAWFIIVLCYCLDIFIVIFSNIIETGKIIAENRVFSFDNEGESLLSATLVGLSVDIGMIGLPMLVLTQSIKKRLCYFVLFISSLLTTFSLLNRTGIVVALVCFIVVIGFRARNNFKLVVTSILTIGFILGVLVYTGVINTELLELYKDRNYDLATMGTRTERWITALSNLFVHPFGWGHQGQIYYVHNMWLDVARISGLIPFILLTYMTLDSFRNAFILARSHANELSFMLLGLNVCFFLSCFVEPIFGGTHFMLYCMLWGTSTALLKT